VLYKHESGTIGTYDKYGKAKMSYDASSGDIVINMSTDRKKEYSRGRSMSFGLVFVERPFEYGGYGGGRPITLDDIRATLGS